MNIRAQVQRLLVEGVPIKRQEVGGGAILCFNHKIISFTRHLTFLLKKT